MRPVHPLLVALALTLPPVTAAASVTEPNGLSVPIDSSPQIQLYTLFANRNESINWQTDAHITPNQFSPLCGFTATYVLNQAGSHFGLAWYNDTGTAPLATDLHALLAPNSPVGATFSGTVIKNDPNYKGGLVGFALVGGETHYTNASYDTQCTGCSPQGPWVTALMYASTATPNAYYICFEDGPTSATSWNNDGDFNDDVYFVTGITCSGGGQPCDTGKPGICAAGLTQCNANGTTCQELNPPAQTETCNGLDDNCNGSTDEGAPCPAGKICDQGTCVAACNGNEFPCPAGLVCSNDGHCLDPKCVNVTCPSGQVCVQGLCKAPCDGVKCPHPQVCRVGVCVDPCAGVTCQAGQVCLSGVCIANCNCQPCAQGKACDKPSGQCLDSACTGVTCGAGTYCVAGNCVDDCAGAVCPAGQTCSAGACVAAPDGGAPPGDDGGLTGPPGDDGGLAGDDASGPNSAIPGLGSPSKAGCGCRAVGDEQGGNALVWVLAVGLTAAGVRRRSRSKRLRT
ncbi:MAG TPA: MopE-related protein [Polyangiaceae bacterium]|jgi:MYXO-CTERM domain-containing protein